MLCKNNVYYRAVSEKTNGKSDCVCDIIGSENPQRNTFYYYDQ